MTIRSTSNSPYISKFKEVVARVIPKKYCLCTVALAALGIAHAQATAPFSSNYPDRVNFNQDLSCAKLLEQASSIGGVSCLTRELALKYEKDQLMFASRYVDYYRAQQEYLNSQLSKVDAIESVKTGLCSELAISAFKKLQFLGIKVDLYSLKNEKGQGVHDYLVLNRDPNSDYNDPSTWGSSCMICDPWLGKMYMLSQWDEFIADYKKASNDPDATFTPCFDATNLPTPQDFDHVIASFPIGTTQEEEIKDKLYELHLSKNRAEQKRQAQEIFNYVNDCIQQLERDEFPEALIALKMQMQELITLKPRSSFSSYPDRLYVTSTPDKIETFLHTLEQEGVDLSLLGLEVRHTGYVASYYSAEDYLESKGASVSRVHYDYNFADKDTLEIFPSSLDEQLQFLKALPFILKSTTLIEHTPDGPIYYNALDFLQNEGKTPPTAIWRGEKSISHTFPRKDGDDSFTLFLDRTEFFDTDLLHNLDLWSSKYDLQKIQIKSCDCEGVVTETDGASEMQRILSAAHNTQEI